MSQKAFELLSSLLTAEYRTILALQIYQAHAWCITFNALRINLLDTQMLP